MLSKTQVVSSAYFVCKYSNTGRLWDCFQGQFCYFIQRWKFFQGFKISSSFYRGEKRDYVADMGYTGSTPAQCGW